MSGMFFGVFRRGVSQRSQLVFRRKRQRFGIQAKPQSRGPWSIIKNMPKMAITTRTVDLGSAHAEAVVRSLHHIFFGNRLEKAGPSGARIEL
jgi:hypothetical protein